MIDIKVDVGPLISMRSVASGVSGAMEQKKHQKKLKEGITSRVPREFGLFVDSRASNQPKKFWHLYESGGVGNPRQRLFMIQPTTGTNAYLVNYGWRFLQAQKPNIEDSRGHKSKTPQVFRNKAWLVENGATVFIKPKSTGFLVFPGLDGDLVFTNKPIVRDFGGTEGEGQFNKTMDEFATSALPAILQSEAQKFERKVARRLERMIVKKRKGRFVKIGVNMGAALQASPISQAEVMKELERSLDYE